jgi:type I restriction enzyme S subunit
MKSKLPEGWKEVKLKDIIELTMGQSPKSEYYNEIGKGMPFMQGNTTFGDKYPAIERYTTKITRLAKRNDLLMSVRAPVGALNFCNIDELCIGRGLCSLRMKNNMQEFLYFLMKHSMQKLKTRETGTVFASINKSAIQNFVVNIPPLKEQKAIADTLSVIDDKIELNNKINKNLEKQSQALFKHWFIDFEFPDENGNPYKSSGGEMIESELGLIPKGWEVKSLEDFSPVITGKKNANIATDNGEYKFFTCSQESSLTDDYSFEGKAILVAGNGDFNVKFYNGKFEAYQRTYVLIPENPELAGFIYYMVKFNLDKIILNARGSVISYLTKGDLENSKIAFPNLQSFENFIETLDIINMKILSNNKQNEKLSQLRDTLLPKLMSGKIRIPLD